MTGVYVILALFMATAVPGILWPRVMWRLGLFGRRWEFANPDKLQPSADGLAWTRFTSSLSLVASGAILAGILYVEHRDHAVDYSGATAGAEARKLDRDLRSIAAARHATNLRDPAVLRAGLARARREMGRTACDTEAALTCAITLHDDVRAARNYASSGCITIDAYATAQDQTVRLLVPARASDDSQIKVGGC